ncbi:hypothetical protein AMECASPLE_002710 [Ameca splendens]|uniref:Uncharacterized protein n=2 Tax=Goodeidae TaxID=28758 RepID=A0ABU7C568_9TELE|nr:hypothetical protein [Ataeniobius toweri]
MWACAHNNYPIIRQITDDVGGAKRGPASTEWLGRGSWRRGMKTEVSPHWPSCHLEEREETIYTGCLGNPEKGKTLKYGNILTIRSWRRTEG